MTTYPGALDTFINPISTTDLSDPTIPHASQHANINDAVKAVETELGVNPRGASATVVARLDANDVRAATKAPLASPTFTGTVTDNGNLVLTNQVAGTIAAVVKGAASQTANLQEWQNSAGAIMSYFTSTGSLRVGDWRVYSRVWIDCPCIHD